MEALGWVPDSTAALLDIGCNVGELLQQCNRAYPAMRLAGIDINEAALQKAHQKLPEADIRRGFGFELPFPDASFQCVTCIEVIEHVPAEFRPKLLREIRRVLVPGGRFIVRCPHAGLFAWLDAQNFRFRFPALYRAVVGGGNRDANYVQAEEELVWHHHFTQQELMALAGEGWELEACRRGGLFLFPLSDILRWPFYRRNRGDHWIARTLGRVGGWELGMNFGRSSYGILLVLRKSCQS
jgi:SAM-dependent methyltransferase